jgi:hypothetical protein
MDDVGAGKEHMQSSPAVKWWRIWAGLALMGAGLEVLGHPGIPWYHTLAGVYTGIGGYWLCRARARTTSAHRWWVRGQWLCASLAVAAAIELLVR